MDIETLLSKAKLLLDKIESLPAPSLAAFERAADSMAGAVERAEQEGAFKGWQPWQVVRLLGSLISDLGRQADGTKAH